MRGFLTRREVLGDTTRKAVEQETTRVTLFGMRIDTTTTTLEKDAVRSLLQGKLHGLRPFQIDAGDAMFGDSLRKYLQNNHQPLTAKAENGRYFGHFVLLWREDLL